VAFFFDQNNQPRENNTNVGIIANVDGTGKDFEVVEEMMQGAVLADIVDKGMVDNKFKPGTKQHKCYFVWIMSEEDSDGKNKRVFESFTVSLNSKATLRKRYKELTGKKDEDIDREKTVDLDSLIGTKRYLVLSQEDGENGKSFIKVMATMPLKKGQTAPDIPTDFQRKQDKQD
jgi:hypothetical protein